MMKAGIPRKFYESESVWVRYLPDNADKIPESYDLNEAMMDVTQKRKLKKLQLTPPIVVARVYYLLRSITEGTIFNDNFLEVFKYKKERSKS